MTIESVLDLAQHCMGAAFEISAPVIVISMLIGVAVAIFQAATQVQEASLAFVPKLIGMALALLLFGGWILDRLIAFTIGMFASMASVGG